MAELTIKRKPYIQMLAPDRATIMWRASSKGSGQVYIGTSRAKLDRLVKSEENGVSNQTVHVTGLEPDTVYYYKVESKTSDEKVTFGGGDSDYFRTAPKHGSRSKTTRIWVIGDSGNDARDDDGLARKVFEGYQKFSEGTHTDVWLMLGDNAYRDGKDSEYQKGVFDVYPELLRNTGLWSTLGNHDNKNVKIYDSIFHHPTNAEAGGTASGTERYYSFDHGDIHFICLDSQNHIEDDKDDKGIFRWLEEDLANNDRTWTIAFCHHPPYTKGSHDSDDEDRSVAVRERALPLLEDYGIDLVLSGHSHCYERSKFITGHYGKSKTLKSSMVLDDGNGSEVGGVDSKGNFKTGKGDGAYKKPTLQGNMGTVAIVAGNGSKVSDWDNGKDDLVNSKPHTVMTTSLLTIGSLVIDINDGRLHAQMIDEQGNVRDDFSIFKGSEVRLATGNNGKEAIIEREGALEFPVTVKYEAYLEPEVNGTPHLSGKINFKKDEKRKIVTLPSESPSNAFHLRLVRDDAYFRKGKMIEINAPNTDNPKSDSDPIVADTENTTNEPATEKDVDNPTNDNGQSDTTTGSGDTGTIVIKPDTEIAALDPIRPLPEPWLKNDTYKDWHRYHFGVGKPPFTAPDEDFDRDGVSNFLEYGLGGHPIFQDPSVVPQLTASSGKVTLVYTVNKTLKDVYYQVRTSTDHGKTWKGNDQVELSNLDDNDSHRKMKAELTTKGKNVLMRLEVRSK